MKESLLRKVLAATAGMGLLDGVVTGPTRKFTPSRRSTRGDTEADTQALKRAEEKRQRKIERNKSNAS